MLSQDDNTLLARVGPGAAMGDLLRQYWIPALTSSEVPEPDGAPVRVRLLGENLIGFRTTSGKVGLIQNHCPHRGASLFFGRNERDGLRCVYHGWKFDVTGACVDMPSEPPESNFASKVCATAYPCVERNDVVFAYMGRRTTLPPLPDLEPNMLAPGEAVVQKVLRECSWFQALEGDIDTSHLGFLHLGALKPEDVRPGSFDYYLLADRAPRYEVAETEFGTTYGAYRPAEADTYYWRIAHFLFPFYTMIPTGLLGTQILVRAWVPIDDTHVMFWSLSLPRSRGGGGTGNAAAIATAGLEFLPETSDWLGRFRLTQHGANDYRIDREAQRDGSFTGIAGIHQQDQAVTESMGPLVDRTQEHLSSSDEMVIRTRRRVLRAAAAWRDKGEVPPGVDDPAVYRYRSGGVILPRSADWREATRDRCRAFTPPPPAGAPAAGRPG